MSQSVIHYVNVSVTPEGVGAQPAGFGGVALLHETSVESGSRLHGPFLSPQDVLDFGYSSGSPPHEFAQAMFSQQPRATKFYVRRADTADDNVTDSLEQTQPDAAGLVYATAIESRTDADILEAAAWQESHFGILIAQTSSAGLLAGTADNIGEELFDLNYNRTALAYYHDDDVWLDAAWMSRCLAFNLDQRKGSWFGKRLNGIAGSSLTNAQVANIRSVNANYFAPVTMSSGLVEQAFTAQGWVSNGSAGAGRRIDTTITLDYLQARHEEALLSVLLRDPNDIPYTDAGINRFATASSNVNARAVRAGHLVPFIVPEGEDFEGVQTPVIFAPTLRETLQVDRANRRLTMSGLAYLRAGIEAVQFNLEARQ